MLDNRLDHVGIAVADTGAALATYRDLFGFEVVHEDELRGNRTTYLDAGGIDVELLEPIDDEGMLATFIEKHGEGLHHLAVEVEDVAAALKTLSSADVRLIDESPQSAAHGSYMAFIHPASTNGVLLQLYEY